MDTDNERSIFWNVFKSIALIALICGLMRGCTFLLMEENFFEGFFHETGWIIGVIALIILIFTIGAIFSSKNKN